MLTQKIIEEIIKNKDSIKVSEPYYKYGPLMITLENTDRLIFDKIIVDNSFIIYFKVGIIKFSILHRDNKNVHVYRAKERRKSIKKILLEELMLILL
jgi:hypothetical protein